MVGDLLLAALGLLLLALGREGKPRRAARGYSAHPEQRAAVGLPAGQLQRLHQLHPARQRDAATRGAVTRDPS